MPSARFWRLMITAPHWQSNISGAFSLRLATVVLAAELGGPSIVGGGEVRASSGDGTGAFDTQASTVWSSSLDRSHWIEYAFATPKEVVELGIQWDSTYPANGIAAGYSVWISDAGLTWTCVRRIYSRTIAPGVMTRFDLSINEGMAGKKLESSMGYRAAANPMFPQPKFAGRMGVTSLGRPRRHTPYSGSKRIAGSTTVLGFPSARRVQLHEQASGVLVAEQHTGEDGTFEFLGLRDIAYTVIGVDMAAEQNSVIYAHVMPTD